MTREPEADAGFGVSGPSLGFGASGPWAERWFGEEKAYRVLRAAIDAGVTDIDTGPSYAGGNAEPRLGRLLRRLAEEGGPTPRLSSKVGTQLGEGGGLIKDFGREAIERQLAASLTALGAPALDVLYLHGPDEHQLASSLPILNKLKQIGRIKAIGVCADGDHVSVASAVPAVDWIMAPYNVLAPQNGDALREAKGAGKKIAVVAPLAQALWRRDLLLPHGLPGLWYAARALATNREGLTQVRRARWLRAVPGWSPTELALVFVRETLAPDLILTTTTNPTHIRQSAVAMRRALPTDLADRLRAVATA